MQTLKDIRWENFACEEASPWSNETYIPCGRPAVAIVWHNKDRKAYTMCQGCANHNLVNRHGILLAKKDGVEVV